MLENYLEEHPKEARIIVDKVILAAKARIAAKKAREMVQRKNVLVGSGLPENWLTAQNLTQRFVKFTWLRETRQVARQNKVVTVLSKRFCLCVVKF